MVENLEVQTIMYKVRYKDILHRRWLTVQCWQEPEQWLSQLLVQFSVAQSCPTLGDPMNLSTPGLPVHHQLPSSNSRPLSR